MVASKPKILMVGPALDVRGGISSLSKELLKNGLNERVDLEYIASMVDGCKLRKAVQAYVSLSRFGRMLSDCDVVHIHISGGASFYRKELFAKAASAKGVPFLLHEHDGEFARAFEQGNEQYRVRVRKLFGEAAKVIVLSEEWRDYFASNVCDSTKIVVLHNAVSLPQTPVDSCAHHDVLFLGRLGARKSPDVLLRAAKALRAQFPKVRYRFAGDGDIEKYKELAKELGVADQCDFIGWTNGDEKERLVRESGVFCLPSRHEGMPMSLLEMMAYGLPCITTPVGGIPQVIRDGENGYMVPVGGSKELASRLGELLSDSQLRVQIGAAARSTIEEEFNISANIRKLVELYREVL